MTKDLTTSEYAPVYGSFDMTPYENGNTIRVAFGFTASVVIYYATWRNDIYIEGNVKSITWRKTVVMEKSLVYAAFP